MKKTNLRISRLMVIMFGMVAGVMTVQQGHAQGCSLATLKGRYQFASAGYMVIKDGPSLPLAVAGIDILDGKGNLSSNSTLIVGGVIAFQNLIVPNGTYTVRKDCTGTLTLGTSGAV